MSAKGLNSLPQTVREWNEFFVKANLPILSQLYTGAGAPGGVVSANRGSIYLRTDGGAGTTMYVKEAGDGLKTGWRAV